MGRKLIQHLLTLMWTQHEEDALNNYLDNSERSWKFSSRGLAFFFSLSFVPKMYSRENGSGLKNAWCQWGFLKWNPTKQKQSWLPGRASQHTDVVQSARGTWLTAGHLRGIPRYTVCGTASCVGAIQRGLSRPQPCLVFCIHTGTHMRPKV